jgi:hypothetical protein
MLAFGGARKEKTRRGATPLLTTASCMSATRRRECRSRRLVTSPVYLRLRTYRCVAANRHFRSILLKKSVKGVGPIFSASLARFLSRDAEDLIGRRRSDVDRPKWNCEAINHRFQMSARFELICAAPQLGTFSTESANRRHCHFHDLRKAINLFTPVPIVSDAAEGLE